MEKFYYRCASVTNSWFTNNSGSNVLRIEKYPHCQGGNSKSKEKASYWRRMFPEMQYGILIEEYREQATYLSRVIKHEPDMMLKYAYYTLDLFHKEANYKMIIGVSDYPGNTTPLRKRAFEKIQRILMTRGYGCLKKEAVDDIQLFKVYDEYTELDYQLE